MPANESRGTENRETQHKENDDSLNALGGSAALLQKVLDTNPQCIFWKDREARYLGCNKLFATITGLDSPSHLVGLTDFDLPWEKEEAEFYRECDRRVMESAIAELGIIESQVNSEGEKTWLDTNKAPLFDAEGQVIGILGVFHDITKIKQAEESLQVVNEKLEERVALRTQQLEEARDLVQQQLAEKEAAFENLRDAQAQLLDSSRAAGMAEIASGVLHNIGNVLNSVNVASGMASEAALAINTQTIGKIADTLENEQKTKGEQWTEFKGLEHLPSLLQATHQSIELKKATLLRELEALSEHIKFIGDIVQSQQMYARAAGLNEVVAVSELFGSALTLVAPVQSDSNLISIENDFEADVEFSVDRQKVVQILSNLIKNAIEAYEGVDGKSATVWLSSKMIDGSFVRLSVRDNEAGISPDAQARLFLFGYTTKRTGHGFGLHTSSNDAIALGGKLSVSSEGIGKGAEFMLDLPVSDAAEVAS